MRVLFYTATAVFLILAGAFAFYALQAPGHSGGAKVVLAIDASEMPISEGVAEEAPERDLYAEAAARLKRLEGDAIPAEADPAVGEEDIAAQDAQEQDAQDKTDERLSGPIDPRELRGSADAGADAPLPEDRAQSEPLPGLPPGTALAGLDSDRPLFKDVEPETPAEVAGTPPDGAPTSAQYEQPDPQLGGPGAEAPADSEPRDQLQAVPEDREAAPEPEVVAAEPDPAPRTVQKDDVDSVLAALDVKEAPPEPAVLAAPSPPLPGKRPAGTPPPARTAALGWAGTQVTTRNVAVQNSARVAILVRGIGRDDRTSTEALNKLPPAISLAFMPFSGSSQELASRARERGHEVIVQLPLEPSDYPLNNPGPETLLSGSSAGENVSRLGTILDRFDGYSGVTNLLGGKMLQSKAALKPVLENLKSRGLLYIGEGNNSHAVVRGLAGEIGLRYGGADVTIDSNPSPAAIKKALERLVALARKDGSAIGMGFASRATIDELEAWSQTLGAEGITLVPVGALAQTPGAS